MAQHVGVRNSKLASEAIHNYRDNDINAGLAQGTKPNHMVPPTRMKQTEYSHFQGQDYQPKIVSQWY